MGNSAAVALELRGKFVVYLRDTDRVLEMKLANLGGMSQKPMIMLGNRRKEKDATER